MTGKLIALIPGSHLPSLDDLEGLAKVFEQIFGRKVTPEEIEEVRRRREEKRKAEGELPH